MRHAQLAVLLSLFLVSHLAWAGPKKRAFDGTAGQVFEAALKVANEQYKVQYKNEQDKTFVFTTGISPLSWGMRVLATVSEVQPGKAQLVLELRKKAGVLSPTQFGAGGRMANEFFDKVRDVLRTQTNPPNSVP